ncbi:putative transcriptional regulator [Pasteurella testudinis DSM 23072]|uniref:Putative transcriptional regulator n=1 Tax=Pasteurella testudinis DSM 23072 TaxID=1122938 RepID=A0A1W1V4W0_9PAST|nr:helix-turn-helix transcriptional regulator [Pasteurella testudinis]SMB88014.1 putative transcriptional regulator [Pasteurella testudinis DSM 23072]SUB51607.1 helix-turn-helix domain-containing protein [Pasteurella testudinis]
MNNIAKIRGDIGVTQIQLANELGFGQPRVANYENGLRVPSLRDCRKIVAALNKLGATVTIDRVFPPSGN